MTIEKWLKLAKQQIASLDAELILLAGLREMLPRGADRSFFVAHPEVGISRKDWEKLDKMLERRVAGEPLAYILGFREFYGRNFEVSSVVLIPRPETEMLVDMALELIGGSERGLLEKADIDGAWAEKARKTPKKWQILEIGTGSGCIVITLALEMAKKGWLGELRAVDLSREALGVAQKNAGRLGAKIELLEGNLLRKSADLGNDEENWLFAKDTKFDLLVANLPYVDEKWAWLDRKSLSFEPEMALFAKENGLALYRRLLEQIQQRKLTKELIVEVDPCQQEEMMELARRHGFVLREKRGFGMWLSQKADKD